MNAVNQARNLAATNNALSSILVARIAAHAMSVKTQQAIQLAARFAAKK